MINKVSMLYMFDNWNSVFDASPTSSNLTTGGFFSTWGTTQCSCWGWLCFWETSLGAFEAYPEFLVWYSRQHWKVKRLPQKIGLQMVFTSDCDWRRYFFNWRPARKCISKSVPLSESLQLSYWFEQSIRFGQEARALYRSIWSPNCSKRPFHFLIAIADRHWEQTGANAWIRSLLADPCCLSENMTNTCTIYIIT